MTIYAYLTNAMTITCPLPLSCHKHDKNFVTRYYIPQLRTSKNERFHVHITYLAKDHNKCDVEIMPSKHCFVGEY